MEVAIDNSMMSRINRVFAIIDNIKPKKTYTFPENYYTIRQVEVDGETGTLIFDFDRRIEYVVYPKPKH